MNAIKIKKKLFVIGTEWKKRVIVFDFAHEFHVESVRFCWGAKIAIKSIFTVDLIPCYILLAHFPLLKPFHTCVCFFLCSILFVQLSCDQCSNIICFTTICFSCHFNYHKKKSKANTNEKFLLVFIHQMAYGQI